ncbi:hypothetical protein Kirov_207 [Bacillus phage Kirov]|uniref:Uncharacterized protein n=1 Tax=Bacillus phage Kirov TaxID=2783539 RepID=A0A7U3RZ30_9CAUD|nr:hypothetical protein PQE67_gp097 [Bacillus phage Kirov]QOV08406.1 hypothetical protein Kirov_207 [Bacillus phage Kirov]
MNYVVREIVKNKDIFADCDFMAIKNSNDTYYILYNRYGLSSTLVSKDEFKAELVKSDEPIILNHKLFAVKGKVK